MSTKRLGALCVVPFFLLPLMAYGSDVGLPAIGSNENRVPAGTLNNGVLTLHLEIRAGQWRPGRSRDLR
jgi:hypothetical protein